MPTFNKTRFYRYLLSFIFGIIVILTFYAIRWIIPAKSHLYNESVTIIFIAVSVLILFPLKKKFLAYVLQKGDYASLVSGDFNDLNFAERPFSVESLYREDFPDFIDWLGLSSGSLALLEAKRKSYTLYVYRKKKLVGEESISRKDYDKLCRFLAKSAEAISVHDDALNPEILAQMKSLNAYTIHPLLYRSVLLGMLIFHQPPRTVYAKQALEIFRHKAALSVQNYILSRRVIDSSIYDQEFRVARRIQKALENTTEPEISAYTIKRLQTNVPLFFEFFKLSQDRWLFVVLVCKPFSGSMGLMVYSILGQLYSLIHLEKYSTLQRLVSYIKDNPDRQGTKHSIRILFMDLNERTKRLQFFSDEKYFTLHLSKKQKNLSPECINMGTYYESIYLGSHAHLEVQYRDTPFLHISHRESQVTETV